MVFDNSCSKFPLWEYEKSLFKTHPLRWHHKLLKGIYGYNIDLINQGCQYYFVWYANAKIIVLVASMGIQIYVTNIFKPDYYLLTTSSLMSLFNLKMADKTTTLSIFHFTGNNSLSLDYFDISCYLPRAQRKFTQHWRTHWIIEQKISSFIHVQCDKKAI